MRTRVKICGITNLEDAEIAVDAGADALGFIFVPETPRYITLLDASNIIQALPPFVASVGVFQNVGLTQVESIAARQCSITSVQLHGTESPLFCTQLPLLVIKVFELQNERDLKTLDNYNVSAYLIDKPKSLPKGIVNWELALTARLQTKKLILAGGLTSDNVDEAIRFVKPYAVDVASGVESDKRKKDPNKIRTFIKAVRQTDAAFLLAQERDNGNHNVNL